MKEVWIVYEEANLAQEGRDAFVRKARSFSTFEKAQKGMAERIAYYGSGKADPFHGKWDILKMATKIASEIEHEWIPTEEYQGKTLAYFLRFFGGEAGEIQAEFLDEDGNAEIFTCFSNSYWDEGWGESVFYSYDKNLLVTGFEKSFPIIATNAFKMDDPNETYYCYVRKAAEEWEDPLYIYISLSKVEVE